eukprot:CAMPEP_0115491944 /NCGR_PEP_ID=MMETSP0271-20121206/63375_1 /TAXON_ID=71861 /ORGANISM="Scrippsiella trochoidea, Strain CCMP3099" /LENGTH=45 /DNA_ID= /DNA_START= /DNA_END= /DNA_ORIENTATION=
MAMPSLAGCCMAIWGGAAPTMSSLGSAPGIIATACRSLGSGLVQK